MRIINSFDVLGAMRRAVEGKPAGYVQEGHCVNHDEVKPICLVGTLLADLLGGIEHIPPTGTVEYTAVILRSEGHAQFTRSAFIAMKTAQILQDAGSTWSEAHSAAEAASCAHDRLAGLGYDFFAGDNNEEI